MATVIAVANQKGGSGKSTTALAIAANLIKRKKKVLFIDSDPQRNSSSVYKAKIQGEATLFDLLCYSKDTTVEETIQHTEFGDIIAADEQLKDADNHISPNDPLRLLYIRKAIKKVEDQYDYVVIDTPPHMGICLANALSASNYVIIPVTCDAFATQGIVDLNETIEMHKASNNPDIKILGILKIRYKQRQTLTQGIESLLDEIAKTIGTKVFSTTIRESVKAQEAQAIQQPLYEYAPTCTAAEDYDEFVKKEIIKKGI